MAGWLRGLKIVAVAVVAHAVWGMARKLTPDGLRVTIAIAAAILTLAWATSLGQVAVIVLGGVVGWLLLRGDPLIPEQDGYYPIRRRLGAALLVLFVALLVGLPFLREATGSFGVSVFDSFYRAGSLVFGGGHVVLPTWFTSAFGRA
jgi:chromate transporter